LQLVAAHRAATTPRAGSPTEPPDSPAPQNSPPGSLAPNYGQHRPYPSRTPLLAPSSTPSLSKHPSKTPLHPIRQPFPLRAFLPVHPHARRGQEGSRSTLLHRWTPPPPRSLGQRWSPPSAQPTSPPPSAAPPSLPYPGPHVQTKSSVLIDLTGPLPKTSSYYRPRPPARGIYRKVFRSPGSTRFPLHRPCFDPCL